MTRFRSLLCVCLLAAGIVAYFRPLAADAPAEEKLSPPVVFSGTHSQIKKETFKLITTAVDWKTAWEEHHGKHSDREFTESHQSLSIDFATHYVVAIFTGWCEWCDVTPRWRENTVVIGYRMGVNQTEGRPEIAVEPDARARAEREDTKHKAQAPYAFVVLPKPVKKVVIEQNVQRWLIGPPEWKYRVTFTATDEKK